ncbi:MAG TPA: hypothetical protein VF950_16430 [Planctomycetota bacterium]
MHLPGGFTKVLLERFCEGNRHWDIPTESIPVHLRGIGSRLIITADLPWPEAKDDAATISEANRDWLKSIKVRENPGVGIRLLNWAPVSGQFVKQWAHAAGNLYAIWPSPVDHDQCFQNAGFFDYADSDDSWDGDFAGLTIRLVANLELLGSPSLKRSSRWYWRSLIWKRTPREILLHELILAAHDDRTECLVEFGSRPQAIVHVDGGHPIWWLYAGAKNEDWVVELARLMANGLPVQRTDLQWDRFRPTVEPVTR